MIDFFASIFNLILWLAVNPSFLLVLWILFLIIQNVWGGLSNFVSIILFPGHIIKRTEQIGLIYLMGGQIKARWWIFPLSKGTSSFISMSPPKKLLPGFLVIFIPMILNFVIAYFFAFVLHYVSDLIIASILIWIIFSLVITGLPDKSDLAAFFNLLISRDPTITFYYVWVIVVFLLFYIGYGLVVSLFISLFYVIGITFSIAFIHSPETDYPIVFDEDE